MWCGCVGDDVRVAEHRTILHADMDAFYAAVEQLDHPELRGKPVIIGSRERRGVVSTASYEARVFGVHSAMPSVEAARRCPDGVWVAPRMQRYVEVSGIVREVFDRFTPLVEPLSLDEAFLDVTGSRALFGDGETIAERLRAEVCEATGGLTVSVGVAATKFVAKVASDLDKPDGLTIVPPGQERAFLAPLPVGRLWGVGKVGRAKLAGAGITTIGQLQEIDVRALARMVGDAAAEHWHALANGLDSRHVETERGAKSIGHERTFHDDLTDREACRSVLLRLSEDVGHRLRAQRLRARTVQLKLRLSPFETLTRRRTLGEPTQSDAVLFGVAAELFERAWSPDRGVRLLGVSGAGLVAADRARQGTLFGGEADVASGSGQTPMPSHRSVALDKALDAVRARHGDGVLRRGGTVDPGRADGL